jgi:hypothetical protein
MLVGPVAGVDDAGRRLPGNEVRDPGGGMPNDQDIDLERFEIPDRIQHRLPFAEAGALYGNIHDIGREALRGQLE